jgi:hypothetical protein
MYRPCIHLVSTMYRPCIVLTYLLLIVYEYRRKRATTATSATPVSPLSSRPTMGADSHRRFYRGRPQPREVPYTPATPTAVLPRSQKRNQQRQRQREASATMPADEVLGLLRQAATAAAGCRALARCGHSSADAHSNLLEALVEALQLHGPVDAAVARHGCTALVSLCRSSADNQAHVVACGAFAAAAACARAHPQHLSQACAAVEAQQGDAPPWHCASWAAAPPQGAPNGSGQPRTPRQRGRPVRAPPLPRLRSGPPPMPCTIALGSPGGTLYGQGRGSAA